MQTRDIKIGSDYVLSGFGGIARARVIETGIKRYKWSHAKADGVRIEVVDQVAWPYAATVVASREIVRPWDEAAQEKMDKLRGERTLAERVEREGDELGVTAFYRKPHVILTLADWDELVARLRGKPSGLHLPLKMPDKSEA